MANTAQRRPVRWVDVLAQVVDGAGADGDQRVGVPGALLQPVGVRLVGLRVIEHDRLRARQRRGHARAQHRPGVLVADHGQPGAEVEAGDQLGLGAVQAVGDGDPPQWCVRRGPPSSGAG